MSARVQHGLRTRLKALQEKGGNDRSMQQLTAAMNAYTFSSVNSMKTTLGLEKNDAISATKADDR